MKLTLHLALRSRVAKSWQLASPAKARTMTVPKHGPRGRDLIKIGENRFRYLMTSCQPAADPADTAPARPGRS